MKELVLTPTSDDDKVTSISDDYVSQVRTFGSLGYTPERICNLLRLTAEQKKALAIRLRLPGDIYNEAYKNGRVIGEYNIDAQLAKQAETGDVDAIKALEERKMDRAEIDLRQQLFGI